MEGDNEIVLLIGFGNKKSNKEQQQQQQNTQQQQQLDSIPVIKMIVYGKESAKNICAKWNIKNMPTGWNAKCNCTKRERELRKKNSYTC